MYILSPGQGWHRRANALRLLYKKYSHHAVKPYACYEYEQYIARDFATCYYSGVAPRAPDTRAAPLRQKASRALR
jgi:hypothetical protein